MCLFVLIYEWSLFPLNRQGRRWQDTARLGIGYIISLATLDGLGLHGNNAIALIVCSKQIELYYYFAVYLSLRQCCRNLLMRPANRTNAINSTAVETYRRCHNAILWEGAQKQTNKQKIKLLILFSMHSGSYLIWFPCLWHPFPHSIVVLLSKLSVFFCLSHMQWMCNSISNSAPVRVCGGIPSKCVFTQCGRTTSTYKPNITLRHSVMCRRHCDCSHSNHTHNKRVF